MIDHNRDIESYEKDIEDFVVENSQWVSGGHIERIKHRERPQLPAASAKGRTRSQRETPSCESKRKRLSREIRGIHHRRLKRVFGGVED